MRKWFLKAHSSAFSIIMKFEAKMNLIKKCLLNECKLIKQTLNRKSTRLNSSHVSISYAVFIVPSPSDIKHLSLHDALPIFLLEDAGKPGQVDGYDDEALLENAKMVSEGSQFGVQYYNEIRGEDEPN